MTITLLFAEEFLPPAPFQFRLFMAFADLSTWKLQCNQNVINRRKELGGVKESNSFVFMENKKWTTSKICLTQSLVISDCVQTCICVWLCGSVEERMRWVEVMGRRCVCVLGVGALVRVRQQRVPHLSRNLSQSSLTNRLSRAKRTTRS